MPRTDLLALSFDDLAAMTINYVFFSLRARHDGWTAAQAPATVNIRNIRA